MNKYIIWGAGDFGLRTLELIGEEKIEFFIDNSTEKQSYGFNGFKVYSLKEGIERRENHVIIIAVSTKYTQELVEQLEEMGVRDYKTYRELQIELTREKIEKRTDYIEVYKKAIQWIKNNSLAGEGIINNSDLKKAYPEVTGYYIPTLIRWGYRDLALSYAKWLCSIQKEDGSWYDTYDRAPYIFDSAQILKGLLAVRKSCPEVDVNIIKGCDWILEQMTEEGRLVTPTKEAWGDEKTCSELIHTYCLSPLVEAAKVLNKPDYAEKAYKILAYYKKNYYHEILNFNLLSHFYSYVMEAMLDMGENELVRKAMEKIATHQKKNGAVAAYNNVDWVCSTGLFQLSLVWFRLGNMENGGKAFEYACKLQNETGGWYGSYLSEENSDEVNTYFPNSEISWAVKYFLDALYYRNIALFEGQALFFADKIEREDGRYRLILENLQNEEKRKGRSLSVLDIGCGKGRYLKNLVCDISSNSYSAVDLSLSVMEFFEISNIEKKQGTLTNIPYENSKFDIVYTCEALEHAIDINSAVAEMARVTKEDGKIIVVDKNKEALGFFEIEEWEQWFEEEELKQIMLKYCSSVEVRKKIDYDNEKNSGLFYAWIGTVKKE